MNYAHFSIWVQERVEDLVAFGVPRAEACQLARAMECGAIAAEATIRSEHQFLLDFKRVGVAAMSERLGISTQAVWNRRRRLLKRSRYVPVDAGVDSAAIP